MKKKIKKMTPAQKKKVEKELKNLEEFLTTMISYQFGKKSKQFKKMLNYMLNKMKKGVIERVINPPPPKEITYKGHQYVLKSSIKHSSNPSLYNEDAAAIRDHSLLQSAREFISNNSSNEWSNDRR